MVLHTSFEGAGRYTPHLAELTRDGMRGGRVRSIDILRSRPKKTVYGQIACIMDEKNHARRRAGQRPYKPGWAAVKYKDIFEAWPAGFDKSYRETPDDVVRGWVKSEAIKWARKNRKQVTDAKATGSSAW